MKTHGNRICILTMSVLILILTGSVSAVKVRAESPETEDPFTITETEGSLDLGQIDLGSRKARFFCLKAELSGAERADLSFYLDEEPESFAEITIYSMPSDPGTFAALLQDREISGEHQIRMDYVIREPEGSGAKLILRKPFCAEDGLPVLEICIDETKGSILDMNGDPEHETKCFGSMKLHIPAGYQEEYTGEVYEDAVTEEYELDYIRGRGNSTWGRSKKPYRIKLKDKEDLLGMGKDKNWAIIANYYDMTMLRNKITYDVASRFLPEDTFVIQSAYVHVMMNGKYLGLYTLSELVRIGKDRLDIDDLEDLEEEEREDGDLITGGYLLNMESMNPEGKIIKTPRYTFAVDSPGPDHFSEKEEEYITGYLTELEERIFEAPDGEAMAACEDMLDIRSYIDHYLIQELCLNGDAYKTDSTHFYKVREGKVYFGPLWDFDYVSWAGDKPDVEGFLSADWSPWMVPLLHDEAFRELLEERWEVLKEIMTEYLSDGGPFDRYAGSIALAQRTNYHAVSSYLWDEEETGLSEVLEENITFESELDRLKTWIRERVTWIDEHISGIRPQYVHVEFRDGTQVIYHQMLERGSLLTENDVPQPMKDGYRLTGFARVKPDGSREALSEEDPMDEDADLLVYQAEWEVFDPDTELKELKFTQEEYEMPSFAYVLLGDYLETDPADFDKRFVKYSMECDPEDCAYLSDDAVNLMQRGEVRVTASCGSRKASCRIVIKEEDGE